MVKVNVKLFGTLGSKFPGYEHLSGLTVDMPDDATIQDLLAHLDIHKTDGYIVIKDNIRAGLLDKLVHGSQINLFQALAGG